MAGKIFAFSLICCCVFSLNSDTLHELFDTLHKLNKSCIKPNLVELCMLLWLVVDNNDVNINDSYSLLKVQQGHSRPRKPYFHFTYRETNVDRAYIYAVTTL